MDVPVSMDGRMLALCLSLGCKFVFAIKAPIDERYSQGMKCILIGVFN
jgi:hypothetical protein